MHEQRLPQVRLAQVLPLLAGPRHRRPVSLVLPRQVVQELQVETCFIDTKLIFKHFKDSTWKVSAALAVSWRAGPVVARGSAT